ncbi:T9SS type A sorting domain-containing protein [Edaphocola aurantiacus]|uniref:T9SS type A sorting domain-containing protein n=1 Tax=Edaphocola aurantiacus TaxID=2601682 RepID=UPI001C948D8D|nr:T9SS type A sorting domain-containing protein [Edaphocola aurantiacus]
MKRLLCILLAAGSYLQTNAQSWQWLQSPTVNGNSTFKKMDMDNNGNIYTVGNLYQDATFGSTTINSPGNYFSLYLTKQSASGVYQFAQRIWSDEGIYTAVVKTDDQANVYVFGTCSGSQLHLSSTYSVTFTQPSSGSTNKMFLAKYSSNGTLIWAKTAESPQLYANARSITNIGGDILIGGDYYGSCAFLGENFASTQANKAFLMRVNPSGASQWLQISENNAMVFITRIVTDGSYVYATGKFQNVIKFGVHNVTNPGFTPGGERIFLFKFDASNGTPQWGKEEGGPANYVTTGEEGNNANALACDANGNVFVGGSYQDAAGSAQNMLQKPFVSKYNASNGTKLWTVNFSSAVENAINSMAIDSNNNLICAGEYLGSFNAGSISLPSDIARKGMILRMNSSDGSVTSATSLGNTGFSANAQDLLLAPNKSFYLIGGVYKTNLNIGTLAVTSPGMATPFSAKYNLGNSVSTRDLNNAIQYSLYPNPCSNLLQVSRSDNDAATITITDLSGKVVYTQPSYTNQTGIEVSNLAAGQYFLKIVTAKGTGIKAFSKQ